MTFYEIIKIDDFVKSLAEFPGRARARRPRRRTHNAGTNTDLLQFLIRNWW